MHCPSCYAFLPPTFSSDNCPKCHRLINLKSQSADVVDRTVLENEVDKGNFLRADSVESKWRYVDLSVLLLLISLSILFEGTTGDIPNLLTLPTMVIGLMSGAFQKKLLWRIASFVFAAISTILILSMMPYKFSMGGGVFKLLLAVATITSLNWIVFTIGIFFSLSHFVRWAMLSHGYVLYVSPFIIHSPDKLLIRASAIVAASQAVLLFIRFIWPKKVLIDQESGRSFFAKSGNKTVLIKRPNISPMKLWQKGLAIFGVGLVLNAVMMNLGVHGLIRELTRLTALVGLGVLVFGAITKK